MAMQFNVRAMQKADIVQIVEIEKMAYSCPWNQTQFEDCLRANYSCWVLEDALHVLKGYGILMFALEEASILNLCVHPQYQRQGLGKRILLHLLNIARLQHIKQLFLEVRASNQAAYVLYQSVGFNEMGMRKNYYPLYHGREDAILLGMELFKN